MLGVELGGPPLVELSATFFGKLGHVGQRRGTVAPADVGQNVLEWNTKITYGKPARSIVRRVAKVEAFFPASPAVTQTPNFLVDNSAKTIASKHFPTVSPLIIPLRKLLVM